VATFKFSIKIVLCNAKNAPDKYSKMKITKTKLYLLFCVALLSSCTFTTTKTKNPNFIDEAKVSNELTSIIKAENINLNGKEIKINNKATSELEVSIINGINIPNTEDQRKAFGKSIGTIIKSNLKDPNEYETYKVIFVTKEETANVTKRNWVGNVFSAKEL
jgi:hypothetical protein